MAYSSIVKPSVYFNTKLYTGNGGTQSITGVGFQPDWCWIKNRETATGHRVIDAVRGNTKTIYTNATQAEETVTNMLTSFDSDGFSIGSDGGTNGNGNDIASWNWKANGAGSANTDGSINSTVSVNQTAGFSIVSWTGTGANATIGHGLGSVPKMILLKCRTQGDKWIVYHNSIGNTKYLVLNDADAETTGSTHWNNTSPTSSVFYTGTSGNVSGTGEDFIAYCFADVQGYSKFGSYIGNGNADGPFVYTGFKPAFVLTKYATSTSGWWQILDNKRDVYNPNSHALFANVNDSEYNLSNYHTDYLSNGFKLRNTEAGGNTSGGTYIYMAFAEEPLVANSGSNGVPATAK